MQMDWRSVTLAIVAVATVVTAAACGRDVPPEEIVQSMRMDHELVPVAFTPMDPPDGAPYILVDLEITNTGIKPLDHLTVLVTLQGDDGTLRWEDRMTLDTSHVRPGIGDRVSLKIPDQELNEGDQVLVRLEAPLPPEEIRTLPEFEEVTGGS
jgi:hypothetical protein